jgi:hypothetical protein
LEPCPEIAPSFTASAAALPAVETASPSTEQASSNQTVRAARNNIWLDGAGAEIMHATRYWVQYGTLGFAVICIVIGAVEGLLGR